MARLRIALLAGLLVAAAGCVERGGPGRRSAAEPAVESGAAVTLGPGETFHFTDHFRGGPVPEGLARGSDGRAWIVLGDAREPVVCAPAPYILKQKLSLPSGGKLRLAFGMGQESANTRGPAVHFTVRVQQNGKTTELLSEKLSRWRGGRGRNWRALTVELPSGEAELELVTESVGNVGPPGSETPAAHAVWVNPTVLVPAVASRPNIVLLVIDDLRADHLGCYGYERDTSPFLDSLASGGVIFEDANSQATATMPSMRGLLSSTHQLVSVIYSAETLLAVGAGGRSFRQLAAMPVSLQAELRRAGYETLACVGGGYLDPVFGFDVGFDWYWSRTETPMLPDQISVVKERLGRRGGSPFFLLLHTYEVHHYRKGYGHGLAQFDHGYRGRLTDRTRLENAVRGDPAELSAGDLQYIHDLYDGEIRHADGHLKSLFGWLAEQPWAEDTVIVITADHGEALGEHEAIAHGGAPYREVTHVPLIILLPDGRLRGRRVEHPVSLVDVTPTLLELAGVPQPADMVGRTLVPLIEGEQGEARPILAGSRAALVARDGSVCYMSWRGEKAEELYDLGLDARQRRNIAASSPRDLERMRSTLAGLAMEAGHGYHLAVAGPRTSALTIELECSSGFSHFDLPTAREGDSVDVERLGEREAGPEQDSDGPFGQRVTVRLAASNEAHVVLFQPVGEKGTVRVSAQAGGRPVAPARLHLGSAGTPPSEVPVVVGPEVRARLTSERPPVPARPAGWGIWLWLPRSAARAESQALEPGRLPEHLRDQLRSLGYLR